MHRVELTAKFVHTAVEPSQLSFKEVSKTVATAVCWQLGGSVCD